jgi:hypothetical protein
MPFKEYDFDPRNLPHDLLAAIGLMTASAAQTEGCVEAAIAGCLGVDVELGKSVTTHMNVLLDAVNEASSKRNAVVHHAWCRDPDNGAIFTVKETSRARYESDLVPMTVDQVKSDAIYVYDAGMRLYSFLMNYNLLPPFPPTDRFRGHKSRSARKKRRDAMVKRSGV